MAPMVTHPLLGLDPHRGFRWWWMALLALCVAVVLLARDPTVFQYPALRVEDGRDVFAYFYSHGNLQEIFRLKVGYIPLLPNIIGYGLLGLPTRWIPYGFVAVPFLFSLLTYCLFFAPAYRYYIKSDLLRATACIFLPLPPFFHYDIHFSVDYIIWNALLLLVLLLLLPAPRSWIQIPWFFLVSILLWSNPLSIVLVPIFLYRFFVDRSSRLVHACCLLSALAYQAFGVQQSQILSNLGWLGSLERAGRASLVAFVLLVKQAYKALFGTKIYMISPNVVFFIFFLLSALVLAFYLRPAVRSRRIFAIYAFYISYSTIFLSIFSRGEEQVSQIEIHMRYMAGVPRSGVIPPAPPPRRSRGGPRTSGG